MKRRGKKQHPKRIFLLMLLLAVLCIGVVELAACKHFAPELYHRITDPVVEAVVSTAQYCSNQVHSAADSAKRFCRETQEELAQRWEAYTAAREAEQLASEPALDTDTPISDPAITELVEANGRQVLTGGSIDITYFCQADEAWARQPYGSDSIGGYGCGPTVMAMVVASMTDVETDPAAMSAWAVSHGYWARRSGSAHAIVPGTAQSFGLQVESFTPRTTDELKAALTSGKLMVALMGPGHFTQRGHFILLRGVTLSGDILVADPNSPQRSLTVWNAQLILDELSRSTNSGAPLWAISVPN